MKAAHRDPLKEARNTITLATVFALTVTGPGTLIAGVILLAVSRSEVLSSIVFVVFVARFSSHVEAKPDFRLGLPCVI